MKEKEKRPQHDFDRKGIKKNAHRVVKKHYVLLLFICLILMFIGTEYNSATGIFDSTSGESGSAEVSSVGSGGLYKGNITGTIGEIIEEGYKKGGADAKKRLEAYKEKKNDNGVMGRTRGVFASAVNSVSSGYLFVQLMEAVGKLSHSKDIGFLLAAFLMVLVYLGIWIFVKNPITAVVRRLFLEARTYD